MSEINPKKMSASIRVPEWLAEGARVERALYEAIQKDIAESMSPDPAVRQARKERLEKARAESERRARIELFGAESRHIVAIDRADGRLRDVLELHHPESGCFSTRPRCSTCVEGGYDPEPAEWPCVTWLTAAGPEA